MTFILKASSDAVAAVQQQKTVCDSEKSVLRECAADTLPLMFQPVIN